jgi:SAM-dependent methyltransferase
MDILNLVHSSVHKRRVLVLSDHLLRFLPSESTVLDIGSGDGLLGYMLKTRGTGMEVHGIDVLARPQTHIPVRRFDGVNIPFESKSFAFALLVDVLHHTEDPFLLLREASRVARCGVVIKDHLRRGLGSWSTLRFMDWIGNARHSVNLPYNYWTPAEWQVAISRMGWKINQWEDDLALYPKPADLVFGRRLHFIGSFRVDISSTGTNRKPGTGKTQEDAEQRGSRWEEAYQDFETPRKEIEKFKRRLRNIGATGWPRSVKIVELFCGRGNGLHALTQLGFRNVEGVDLSPNLLEKYCGQAKCYLCDCRKLPFADGAYDVVIVQGGLHHLPKLPEDLSACLDEICRILKPGGSFVSVEPWQTPFLGLVHALCFSPARRLSKMLGALATMIEEEEITYEAWLGLAPEILMLFERHFISRLCLKKWGKLLFVGTVRSTGASAVPLLRNTPTMPS